MNPKDCIKLNTGQLIPLVGLGTAGCHDDEMRLALRTALECGYRSLDTASFYKNEKAVGEELHDWFTKGKLQREDVFVTTKLPPIGNRREDVATFLEKSLRNMKLEYLDLYLIHHPFGVKGQDDDNSSGLDSDGNSILDYETDLESLWKGMEEQVDAGRTKAIGVSNFNSEQIQRILRIARIPPAVNQIEVHGRFQQLALVEKCQKLGIAVVAYFPLGAPYLKTRAVEPIINHPSVLEIGKRHGKSGPQVLLKFLVQRGIIVIPKSTNPGRIKSNIEISDFELSDEDMKAIYKLDQGAKARILTFTRMFKGVEKHKEYPFALKE